MTMDDIRTVDRSGMHALLRGFPTQVREATVIGAAAGLPRRNSAIRSIVLTGLGGSAIGGDLLKSYLADELRVPMLVNRHYTLPRFVGRSTLVIVSSYSGNTEETIAAHAVAMKRHARVLCISSGGTTLRRARRSSTPFILIPGGLPPRAALGYSFFPLLIGLSRMGFITSKDRAITETIRLLERNAATYADPSATDNRALQLAHLLKHRMGVIYSSTERFDAVAARWRGQMAENAKTLMFGHVIPEMNHNELVGWNVLKDQMREMQVIFLRDREDHRRVTMRMDFTRGIIANSTPRIAEAWSEGTSRLARMFSLVQLGDWVSFYLAILHNVDPTPVEVIDQLKEELART
jgi:glucose/mannose-6-phosphate isomerase